MAYQINSTLGAKARYTGVSRMAKANNRRNSPRLARDHAYWLIALRLWVDHIELDYLRNAVATSHHRVLGGGVGDDETQRTSAGRHYPQ